MTDENLVPALVGLGAPGTYRAALELGRVAKVLEDLQLIADSLAARLQRSVAIDNPQMRLLVHTAHRGEAADRYRVESIMQKAATVEAIDWAKQHGIETATLPVRIPEHPEIELAARVCVPVRHQGRVHAYLWLLDQGSPLTDEELAEATQAADAAGRVLYQELLLGDLRRAREREMLRDLFASEDSVREQAARQLIAGDRVAEDAKVVIIALQVRATESDPADVDVALDLAAQHAATRLTPAQVLWTTRTGAGAVLLVAARQPPRMSRIEEIATGLRAEVLKAISGSASVRVGIGPLVSVVALAHESHGCALDALRVAADVAGYGNVVSWDSLGIYRLLVRLPLDHVGDSAVPAGLLRLVESDESGVLAKTLEVYLDEAGNTPATVDRLQIHRTSLYYRLHRIEDLTGMSLSNGSDRLALHLGVKLLRLVGGRL